MHLGDFLAGHFVCEIFDGAAGDRCFQRPAHLRRDGLASGEGLPGDPVEFAFALFYDDQDGFRHKN